MRFDQLHLYTHRLEEELQFYSNTLGFPLIQSSQDAFTVQVGWTELTFHRTIKSHQYHYCFLIPSNQLQEAKAWFEPRARLIEEPDGAVFHHFESWNAESFYFYDASGNIAECIVRHDLNNPSDDAFDQHSICGVNEMGIAVTNVADTLDQFDKACQLPFWKGNRDSFGTCGDQEGLFVLVDPQLKKSWYPTERPPTAEPFETQISVLEGIYSIRYEKGDLKTRKLS